MAERNWLRNRKLQIAANASALLVPLALAGCKDDQRPDPTFEATIIPPTVAGTVESSPTQSPTAERLPSPFPTEQPLVAETPLATPFASPTPFNRPEGQEEPSTTTQPEAAGPEPTQEPPEEPTVGQQGQGSGSEGVSAETSTPEPSETPSSTAEPDPTEPPTEPSPDPTSTATQPPEEETPEATATPEVITLPEGLNTKLAIGIVDRINMNRVINEQRFGIPLERIVVDQKLQLAAEEKADLLLTNYIETNNCAREGNLNCHLVGGDSNSWAREKGYSGNTTEVLIGIYFEEVKSASGHLSDEEILENMNDPMSYIDFGLLGSKPHRDILLSQEVVSIGVGCSMGVDQVAKANGGFDYVATCLAILGTRGN